MKCIKNQNGDIKRVSNEHAERVVSLGTYSYVTKSQWKLLRVSPVIQQVSTDDQKREIQRKADKRKHRAAKRSYRKN